MGNKSVKEFRVLLCERKEIKDFIEKWHYSRNINGLKTTYCFKLLRENEIIGAMVFGWVGMANAWKKYGDSEKSVIELRRLCCIDDTPKNTESYFIGQALKWLIKNTEIKTVISYADPEYSHTGIIYKATNFEFQGRTAKGRVIIHNERRYHDKTIRTYHNGELKPYAQRLRDALEEGEAFYKQTEGKYIYVYDLKSRRKKTLGGMNNVKIFTC